MPDRPTYSTDVEALDELRDRLIREYVHPAPEVPARPATADEVPRGALGLGRKAVKAGFQIVALYSRGHSLPRWSAQRREYVGKVVDSLTVRGRHPDGRAFVACYTDGKADKIHYWRGSDGTWQTPGAQELSRMIGGTA